MNQKLFNEVLLVTEVVTSVSNCEHACILTQDGWGRPILTELMIFDQSLNFNRVTIIIRIFHKLNNYLPPLKI